MKKFNKFYFKKFEFNDSSLQATFSYSFDNEVFFEEIIDFNNRWFKVRNDFDIKALNNLLFHLHIALGISYYKASPTKDMVLESGILNEDQMSFWRKFYLNWLWEFLYSNNISPDNLFNFKNESSKIYEKIDFNIWKKTLISVWWWKDSIVSIELLKKSWLEFDLFVFWKNDDLKSNTAKIANKNILLVKRIISSKLFELNNEGYYNWHVPITWIIAFVKEVTAYLFDYKYLILSNEKSANFWNIVWGDLSINHQYSKSLDFEKDFSEYIIKYISNDVKYFSLLRWMYEVKIAELFVKYWKEYFSVFSSCNKNFTINKNNNITRWLWCNKCPKCLFVYSILRPYLNDDEIINIFWEDLFNRKDLEWLFRKLLGISWFKPFECVWEKEEVIYSMYKSLTKYDKLPYILKIFKEEILDKMNNQDIKNIQKKLVTIYNEDIIPAEFKKLIFKNI